MSRLCSRVFRAQRRGGSSPSLTLLFGTIPPEGLCPWLRTPFDVAPRCRDRVEHPGRRTRACRSRPARRYRTDTGNTAIDRWHAEGLVASSGLPRSSSATPARALAHRREGLVPQQHWVRVSPSVQCRARHRRRPGVTRRWRGGCRGDVGGARSARDPQRALVNRAVDDRAGRRAGDLRRVATADAGASLHGYFHFEQFLRVSESNLFLVFAWQIDSAEPVGLLLYVRERIVGCEHHSIHAYVLQQESE